MAKGGKNYLSTSLIVQVNINICMPPVISMDGFELKMSVCILA